MATASELFIAVLATASVILVPVILILRSPGQLLKPPKIESSTLRIDDIPADHTGNQYRSPKSIVEQNLVLRRDANTLTPKAKKSLTLRIDDIPADDIDSLDRNLKSILEKVLDLERDSDTIVRRSLVPFGKKNLCATISIITSLSADDLSARLHQAGSDHPYKYTCKFEGITPLYEDKNHVEVDIIAVPRLGSHALGSWKSPNSDDVWLRDFLHEDVPNIRVLLYGYDTTLPGSLSKQSIKDLGGALLERLIAFRARDGTSYRPIIFIGHSLGGLLIKEALIQARRPSNEANSDLSKACFAMLFFGVPNLGLRNDQLKTLVRGQPNEALIRDLLVDGDFEASNFLKRLADQFSESCKGYYRVVSFFERRHSQTLREQDGKWSKTGAPSLLVTEKSATSTGLVAVADQDNISLDRDHSGLVKYGSKNQGDYTVVAERLRRLTDEAKREVVRRFAEHNLYQPPSDITEACLEACLKSLAFEDMDGRQANIDYAADGTCKWLLEHEILIEWTRQDRGLLWIKGKPGSGKSTLMKYARDAIPSLYGTDALAFSFFFHGRGHELQRNPLGLFRSLLHQILKRVPGAVPDLINYFEDKQTTEGECGKKWQWYLQPLQTILKSSIPRILRRFPVILFIDALNECGEQPAVELIEYLKHLRSSLPPMDSRFGIFFSCRHYPILELGDGLTILLDTENNVDITTYVHDRFSADPDYHIERLISGRAQGIFMWAHLVVERVLRMKRRKEPRVRIEAEIMQTPQRLNDLYHGLIQSVESRSVTLRLMEWICFSMRPLTLKELQWAMAVDPNQTYKSLDECQGSEDFIHDGDLDTRIMVLSCGLAEIVPSYYGDSCVVQFIHQSVKDFLVNGGLLALDGATKVADLVVPAAHCRLSRACLYYFKLAAHSHAKTFTWRDTKRFPLVHYATASWLSHVQLGGPAETSPSGLLDLLGWPQESLIELLMHTPDDMGFRNGGRLPSGLKLIHVISIFGLAELLPCLLQESVVKMLLETDKVNVDAKDNFGLTPLSWATKHGHKAVVQMLLETGKVDVDARSVSLRKIHVV
ncbi:ankyrin repeat-containing protein [Stachybotrys elegans]|uniref:Ankyrin repeat-containing protein n=1 Tax=Stachybotrys elegans TaxID=80388 RepID=A0A8K0WLA7_9HYPO|nr:ankyrin repeat-containing protein [Stachybotrys elegans]